jgi:ParB family chromosome partitioning protein
MALIENIQRENLNPLEEARALQRLILEFDVTHEEAAQAVGRSRAGVSNLLRLLELPEAVRALVEGRQLDMGHARALLGLPEAGRQQALAEQAVAGKWSVRETEARVRAATTHTPPQPPKPVDPDLRRLETDLSDRLGARVQIRQSTKGKGQLVIDYTSLDVLDGILAHLRGGSDY